MKTYGNIILTAAVIFWVSMALRPAQASIPSWLNPATQSIPVKGDWDVTQPAPKPSVANFLPYQGAWRPGATITVNSNTIMFNGRVGPDDFYRLGNVMIANPQVRTVVLSSPGGYVLAALKIGMIIHTLEYATVAADMCGSACVIIWASGTSRTLRKSASLLMHCVYDQKTKKCDPQAAEMVEKFFREWDMPAPTFASLKTPAAGRTALPRTMAGLVKP